MKKINIEQFVNSYLETASWVECDSNECTDFTKQGKEIAGADCSTFISLVIQRFGIDKAMQLLCIEGNDLTYLAPHDLYLTRNGHGAGFWDKEEIYGIEESEALTEIATSMGESTAHHLKGKKSKLTFI